MSGGGTLSVEDFDSIKKGQNEKSVKGTVCRKIKVMPDMMKLFRGELWTEENFIKKKYGTEFFEKIQ